MKRLIPPTLDTIAWLALAVWLGGLTACWLVVGPAVRHTGGPIASALFTETLRRFGGTAEICGAVLVGVQWLLRRRYQADRQLFILDAVRTLALFVAFFAAEYSRYILIPRLQKGLTAFGLPEITVAQALFLVVYAAITVWLQGRAIRPVAPAAPNANPSAKAPPAPRQTAMRKRAK
ncbi:MAG TPA: hypothetical protein VKT77_07915 [Chthonomonadaceae bacterium]|nr:hypothetical protein [Chthonomonadaceae bacterium]